MEGNAQVEMMGTIYRQALGVLAWVGEGTSDSDFGMKFLQEHGDISNLFIVVEAKVGDGRKLRAARTALGGLQDLFLRPYWTRVWTVQESVLNQDFFVCCGDHTVEWDVLVRGIQDLRRLTVEPVALPRLFPLRAPN